MASTLAENPKSEVALLLVGIEMQGCSPSLCCPGQPGELGCHVFILPIQQSEGGGS